MDSVAGLVFEGLVVSPEAAEDVGNSAVAPVVAAFRPLVFVVGQIALLVQSADSDRVGTR